MYVYVVIKLGSTFTPAWSGGNPTSKYRFGYLRMKHHIVNLYTLLLLAKDWTKVYSVSVDSTWVYNNHGNNAFGQFTVDTIDVQLRNCNAWSWHYFSINTGTAYNTNFNGNEPSEIVIEITFVAGKTFSALNSSYTICSIDTGVIGYDSLNPVTCTVTSSLILIKNVYALTNTQLKIFYYAKMACSQGSFDVMVKAFANQDAYNDYNWPLFASQTGSTLTLNTMWYSNNPSNSAQSTY
jgi:hypothetical protein